ncbi:MAG: hypothetical protein COA43_04790 [Robiginitomaculum sp.]|nr:MAG: hypothetical protein COA43_04790 [Robiginitomaculum sp.]
MTHKAQNLQSEDTEVGEQTLINGVCPVTLGERLTARTFHPMTPKRNPSAEQKPCDLGLFDAVGRAQIDIRCERSEEVPLGYSIYSIYQPQLATQETSHD